MIKTNKLQIHYLGLRSHTSTTYGLLVLSLIATEFYGPMQSNSIITFQKDNQRQEAVLSKDPVLKKSPQIEVHDSPDKKLVIYQPVDLQCYFTKTRPVCDQNTYLSVPAAFTTPAYDIDGMAIENGIIIQPKINPKLTGCCIVSPESVEFFAGNTGNIKTYAQLAKKNKSGFFQQMLLVKDYLLFTCALFGNKKDYRRAMVEWNQSFAIIESKDPMSIKAFQDAMIALSVKNAVYLDMGSWSEGFYFDGTKIVKIGHDNRSTDKQRSWVVFRYAS